MSAVTEMRCAECGRVRAWRDGFPDRLYAVCWPCAWKQHAAEKHPPRRRWHLRWPLFRDPVVERPAPLLAELVVASPESVEQP